jgi:DNA-binding MarR family transcriptional regulator
MPTSNAPDPAPPNTADPRLPPEVVRHVAGTCLCLHAQRAARALARRFDTALKPLGLTNGQFSLLMALNQPQAPSIGQLAPFLAMDRTTLTAALKPLERRGLAQVLPDSHDRRSRRVAITAAGVALLGAALPVWQAVHGQIDAALLADLAPADPQALRDGMTRLARLPVSPDPTPNPSPGPA